MSLENIKSKTQAQRGFTIVELLIVVVVIAILAAITIVSYNGITARANQSAAKASAATFQKKAELYAADSNTNRYPIGVGTTDSPAFPGTDGSKTWYYTGVTAVYGPSSTSALTTSSGNSALRVLKCAASGTTQASITSTNISGLRVFYWDPLKSGGAGEVSLDVGTTTACPDAV
jgi:type IV pilus assembly protein PilA